MDRSMTAKEQYWKQVEEEKLKAQIESAIAKLSIMWPKERLFLYLVHLHTLNSAKAILEHSPAIHHNVNDNI